MESQETGSKASQTGKPTSAQGGSASGGNPILWVVLGVVVLAVAGGIWYAVAQSNGSTNAANNTANANTVVNNSNAAANTNADSYAGWKTYMFEGFSLRYPADWEAESIPESNLVIMKPLGSTYFLEGSEITPIKVLRINTSLQIQKEEDRDSIVSEESINGISSYRREGGPLHVTEVLYAMNTSPVMVMQFFGSVDPVTADAPLTEELRGTFELIARSATRQSSTNADPYAGWKTYQNTKYSYTIQLPGSWGRLSEFDGSYDLNINDPNTQNTGYVVFGRSEEDEEIVILIHEKTSVQAVISADPHSNAPATEYLTSNSIPGKFASYGLGNTWPEAYLFQHGSDVVEIGVLKSNTNTKLVVDSLQLQ